MLLLLQERLAGAINCRVNSIHMKKSPGRGMVGQNSADLVVVNRYDMLAL